MINIYRTFISIILLILSCGITLAQPSESLSSSMLDEWGTIQHFHNAEGLKNTYVNCITQDSRGCMWFGTSGGLFFFTGKSFTHYNTGNSNLTSNFINCLLYSPDSNILWIGSRRGLFFIHCTNDMKLEDAKIEPLTNVFALSRDRLTGDIWVANAHNYIVQLSSNGLVRQIINTSENKELPSSMRCILYDGNDNLFIGTSGEGLYKISRSSHSIHKYLHKEGDASSIPSNHINALSIDSIGHIWIGSRGGLSLYNPQYNNFSNIRTSYVSSLSSSADGKYLIGSAGDGVSVLETVRTDLRNFNDSSFQTLSINDVNCVYSDNCGNMWIGRDGWGIDFISHRQPMFRKLTQNQIPVYGLARTKDSSILVGTTNKIYKYDYSFHLQGTFDFSSLAGSDMSPINVIYPLDDERILFGMVNHGLNIYNPKTNKSSHITPEGIELNMVHSIISDGGSKLYICSERGLICYDYKSQDGYQVKNPDADISEMIIYSTLRDLEGRLWVATYGSGVCVFDKDMNFITRISTENGLHSGAINHMILDSNGNIWIATTDGISCVDGSKEKPFESRISSIDYYGHKDGLVDSNIKAIIEDKQGYIWFSSVAGIAKLNPKTHTVFNYDHGYGMNDGCFNNYSVCDTYNNQIIFGSLYGAYVFNPQEELILKYPIFCISQITHPYGLNSFCFNFTCSDFSLSNQIEYGYQIEGISSEWVSLGNEQQLTLQGVQPGNYKLNVRMRIKNQPWKNDNIQSYSFHIAPPFYLSWWAYIIYFLIVSTIFYLLFRNAQHKAALKTNLQMEKERSQNITELNNERMQFYTNITHELRTPLTLIIGPLEDMAHKNKALKTIHSNANRLLALVNQLLEFRTTETKNKQLTVSSGNISDTVREVGMNFIENIQQSAKKRPTIIIDIENDVRMVYDKEIVTTIVTNFMSNAVKYSNDAEVRLEMKESDDKLIIEVKDKGFGISEEALPHIFERYYQAKGKHQASGTGIGLSLVKSLADLHEAQLSVKSKEGYGSTFTVVFDKTKTYPNAIHKTKSDTHTYNNETGSLNDGDIAQLSAISEKQEAPLVLIVEDNIDIRNYIDQSISSDYRTLTATNGREGWELCLTEIPDAIISDIMMPEMDGYELLHLIKNDMRTSHIPVIFLTAKDSINDKERGYEYGADSYLTKPFSARLLLARLHNIMEQRRRYAEFIQSSIKNNSITGFGLSDKNTTHSDNNPDTPPVFISALDQKFIVNLDNFILENIDNSQLDIALLTDKMAMSHSTLYRKIKSITGLTANEYIRKKRLAHSITLINSKDYNITDIAYLCGFTSLRYYRQCFKDEYGVTPSEWKETKT